MTSIVASGAFVPILAIPFALMFLLGLPASLPFEIRNKLRGRGRGEMMTGHSEPPTPRTMYTGPSVQPTYTTTRGDVVKSRAEAMIADFLFSRHIRYEYERMVTSNGQQGGKPISRPDFYILDYNVYIEYWGLVDHPDSGVRQSYGHKMRWKMAQYYRNKLRFISLYPSDLQNLDASIRRKFRVTTGSDFPIVSLSPPSSAQPIS